ncbi:hypothetical protein LINPERPRIM_LOCUS36879 [Linum perenne]
MSLGVYNFSLSRPMLAYWSRYDALGVSETRLIVNEGYVCCT